MFDVLIIGAGVCGCFVARELSQYNLSVALLEKSNDVGNATSSANSAIIHSGYDPIPGTLKAKFNLLGNLMFEQIAKELDVDFKRCGSLTVALNQQQFDMLKDLKKRANENGVEVELLDKQQTLDIEPNLSSSVVGSLLAKTAGVIDPFNLCVNAAENAIDNGVQLFLSEEVVSIENRDGIFYIKTKNNEFLARFCINCAGLYSDKIASMIEDIDWKITPRKGQYFMLNNYCDNLVKHTIFPLPSEKGKGILVSPTTSSNFIVGPSSELNSFKDDVSTDKDTLQRIKESALDMIPLLNFKNTIRTFSGNRATCTRHDFVIEPSKKYKSFINVGGIESPGLVSSPAIAKYVVNELLGKMIKLEKKDSYNPYIRKKSKLSSFLTDKNRLSLNDRQRYQIICNCEKVTLGEIEDCLSRSCPPHSVKGVKRRTRAGFGQCQGGFCQSKIVFILAKHYGISPLEVPYDDNGSNILLEKVKK